MKQDLFRHREEGPVKYHLAKYADNLLMEGVGLDDTTYEMIKAALPAVIQERLLGWRNLAVLPHGKGEMFIPHPLDAMEPPRLDDDGRTLGMEVANV